MNIVLGVSGSVAAYRAADLARELMRGGFKVRVCLTDAAQKFVSPALFEALTGEPCLIDTFEEPVTGRMAHIDWARQADLVLIAPATANTLNKLAAGIGDDMLTTIALATTKPLIVAPAMNPAMYTNEVTLNAIEKLTERGVTVIEPTEGDVACGENGQGKLASIPTIVRATLELLETSQKLASQRVLITSGPTREAIDSVRFLSNRSSGRMGAALAQAAQQMGAQVTVVTGPVSIGYPIGTEVIRVESAEQMLQAALGAASTCDWIIGAAAVADYRPEKTFPGKLRRGGEALELRIVPNPDIIATLAKEFPRAKVVGFAAEPSQDTEIAQEKLKRKGLFAIVANDVSQANIGFDSRENALTLLTKNGTSATSGQHSKLRCALWLWEKLLA